jgi:hypothetical protein
MRTEGNKEWLKSNDLQGGNRHDFSRDPGVRFTNQNSIEEKIKSRLKSGNV